MDNHAQIGKARLFRQMHDRHDILVLPNAWDAGSARVFARAGFRAVATTSAGVAWSLGYADGENAPLDEVLEATARIARSIALPVSADIETGYGATPEAVAATVRAVIAAGAVGVNIEDRMPATGRLRAIGDAAERIRAAHEAASLSGVPIVINARTDTYLIKYGAGETERFEETLRRAQAYLAAGADCVYPIGLGDDATLGALVKALDAPVNVAARPGMPSVAELMRLGVARVSTATRFATIALSSIDTAARQLRESGRFECLESALTHPEVQGMFGNG